MQNITWRGLLMAVARPLGWVVFFSCFLNVSYLAAPLYMMQVYDRVMHSQSLPTLLYLTLAVALSYATFALLDAVRGQILAGVSDVVEDTLAARLLHSATAPLQRGQARPGPGHIGRDLDTVRQFAAGAAVLAFIDLPWAVIYLGVLFLLHWVLGAFAIAAGSILLALSVAGERAARGPMAQAGAVAGRAYQFGDAIARHADCASTMGLGASLAGRWRDLRAEMLAAQNAASRRAVSLGALAKFVRMLTAVGNPGRRRLAGDRAPGQRRGDVRRIASAGPLPGAGGRRDRQLARHAGGARCLGPHTSCRRRCRA